MGKAFLWFWLSCKRELKKPVFLAVLLLLPFAALGLGRLEKKEGDGISVALYAAGNGLESRITETLADSAGMFQFYICDNEQALKDDVMSGKAECGYVFPQGLIQKLDDKKFRGSITVYTSPSTVAEKLSSEVVFSRLFEVYGRSLLEKYVKGPGAFAGIDQDQAAEKVMDLYENYYGDGSTFSFRYETADSRETEEIPSAVTFPVRGVAAVFVFAVSLFGAVSLCADEEKGLYIPVPYGRKTLYAFAAMVGPVILSACSAVAAIWICGAADDVSPNGFLGEAVIMAAYGFAVTVIALLIKAVIRNRVILSSLIPFLTMGSLILCPVFLDVGTFFPGLERLSRLFPAYYYLRLFL